MKCSDDFYNKLQLNQCLPRKYNFFEFRPHISINVTALLQEKTVELYNEKILDRTTKFRTFTMQIKIVHIELKLGNHIKQISTYRSL